MKVKMRHLYLCAFVFVIAATILPQLNATIPKVSGDYIRPGISAAEMLRARGYLAREYYFVTRDEYVICATRGTNPLINRGSQGLSSKLPILFIHGATVSSASFMIQSKSVEPRNFARVNTSGMALDALVDLVGDDPSASSLPLIALNFGYESWFIDRRGYGKSRHKLGHMNRTAAHALRDLPRSLFGGLHEGFSLAGTMIPGRPNADTPTGSSADTPSGANTTTRSLWLLESLIREEIMARVGGPGTPEEKLKRIVLPLVNFPPALISSGRLIRQAIQTFDPDYWDFSFDEQIEHDFPAAIDFVRAKTGAPKVHVVTLSASGAVVMLALANKPQLGSKIAQVVHWAPSVTMGSHADVVYQLGYLGPFLQSYIGPLPFTFAVEPVESIMQIFCSDNSEGNKDLCERFMDQVFGFSGRQAPMVHALWATGCQSASVNELMHLGQFARTRTPCKFSFNTQGKNLARYEQRVVPCYDLSRLRHANMSIYVGAHDRLVSVADVNTTVSHLKVPYKVNVIKGPDIYFNHLGFLLHKQTARLAILPSLLDIERYEYARPRTHSQRVALARLTSKRVRISRTKLLRKKEEIARRKKVTTTTTTTTIKRKKKVEAEKSKSKII